MIFHTAHETQKKYLCKSLCVPSFSGYVKDKQEGTLVTFLYWTDKESYLRNVGFKDK